MSRDEAIEAYGRVRDLERTQTRRLLADLRARGACDPIPLTLHNWGRCNGTQPYADLDREYRYRQRVIWDRAARLSSAFARYF